MLYLVSTPIGNLGDITLRALEVLREADVILAEDSRHTGLLLSHFQIPHKPMVSFYEEVEKQKMAQVVTLLREGKKVALVSDAGTPLISDPGYKLVREILRLGLGVQVIPGPSAVTAALVISGLPPDKFLFLGYPPEKSGHRRKLFADLAEIFARFPVTVIFFLSPHKLRRDLDDLLAVYGDREIVLARELTKIHEESWRGRISEALERFTKPVGEFVLLFNWKEQ